MRVVDARSPKPCSFADCAEQGSREVVVQIAPGIRTSLDLCTEHRQRVEAARGNLKAAAAMICPSTISSTLTGTGRMRCTRQVGHPGSHQNWRYWWDDAGAVWYDGKRVEREVPITPPVILGDDEDIEDDEDSEDNVCPVPGCGGELFPVEDDVGNRTTILACNACGQTTDAGGAPTARPGLPPGLAPAPPLTSMVATKPADKKG